MTGSTADRSPGYVVLKCSSAECGMRYPSPADDPRRDACPLCAAPTVHVADYHEPFVHDTGPTTAGSVVAVLDNIRSALNVGTMLRSADGARIDHVHLCGLTAGVENPKVIKTALGAEQAVPTTSHADGLACIAGLAQAGYEIWALESTADSGPLQEVCEIPPLVAFVVGNERSGIDPGILTKANRRLHLPMSGSKTSLNVGVVFGIAAYLLRSKGPSGVVSAASS